VEKWGNQNLNFGKQRTKIRGVMREGVILQCVAVIIALRRDKSALRFDETGSQKAAPNHYKISKVLG
jgi:hypothetical protein